jgi:hypothetical protein
MRTALGDKIFSVIRRHYGHGNAITAAAICDELGWTPGMAREVRRIVSSESHLWPGVLVCAFAGRGAGGYFVAETYDEALEYWNWLQQLAAVASQKVFNFEQACSKMGIRFQQQQQKTAA